MKVTIETLIIIEHYYYIYLIFNIWKTNLVISYPWYITYFFDLFLILLIVYNITGFIKEWYCLTYVNNFFLQSNFFSVTICNTQVFLASEYTTFRMGVKNRFPGECNEAPFPCSLQWLGGGSVTPFTAVLGNCPQKIFLKYKVCQIWTLLYM